MTISARHIFAAAMMGAISLTATISLSAYNPNDNFQDAIKSDILIPARIGTNAVVSTASLKQDRAEFGLTAQDRHAIQSTIRKQIGAFAAGDAATAYDLAAPRARADYQGAEEFLTDLSDIFGLLTVARLNRMDGLDLSDGIPSQRVLMTSPSGDQWMAEFTMEKHEDGSWKVLGVMIEDAPGEII
ncbi:MAG: hypothetical protein C0605_13930 [Hyphomicrobiales bacterium]|nr:MAG: hypothetical protein C0605_13930 [Hyphomicrobiales bacterium]